MAMENMSQNLVNFFSDWNPYFELCDKGNQQIIKVWKKMKEIQMKTNRKKGGNLRITFKASNFPTSIDHNLRLRSVPF